MPIYHIDTEIENADGTQTWEFEASTKEEALEKYNQGDGDIVAEEIEVTRLRKPELSDVYEAEASTPQHDSNSITKLCEAIRSYANSSLEVQKATADREKIFNNVAKEEFARGAMFGIGLMLAEFEARMSDIKFKGKVDP